MRKYDRNKTRDKVTEKVQYAQAKRLKKLAKEMKVPFKITG
ncbi:hypothetical protein [Halobacillus trueperi]|nr:hypothetical protein [Halobacillus trueperi]